MFRPASNSGPSQQYFYFSIFCNRWRWVWNSWAIGKIWSLCGSLQWEWISGHLGERSHPCQVLQIFQYSVIWTALWPRYDYKGVVLDVINAHYRGTVPPIKTPRKHHACATYVSDQGEQVAANMFHFLNSPFATYTTGCFGHWRNQSPWWEIWSKHRDLLTIRGQLVHWISTSKATKKQSIIVWQTSKSIKSKLITADRPNCVR